MEIAFGIVVTVIFLLFIFGPILRRAFAPLLQRWAMGKMEDTFRRMAGMPTRKEEKKAAKRNRKNKKDTTGKFRNTSRGGSDFYGANVNPDFAYRSTSDRLQVIAEDVEYKEIKEFGEDFSYKATKVTYTVESQVEDAEYTELPKK